MTVPEITVHNLQRKISVNVAELEKFAGNAVQHSLQLQKRKRTDLRKLERNFRLVDFRSADGAFASEVSRTIGAD